MADSTPEISRAIEVSAACRDLLRPASGWPVFAAHLERERTRWAEEILGGCLELIEYHSACARYKLLNELIQWPQATMDAQQSLLQKPEHKGAL